MVFTTATGEKVLEYCMHTQISIIQKLNYYESITYNKISYNYLH